MSTNFFEDFGIGKLKNGKAHIELDKDFLKIVTIDDEHPMLVFVQPYGLCNGLYSSYLLYGATQSITGESKDSMYLEQAGFYTLQTLPPIALQEKKNRELKYAFSCPYPNPSRGAVNLSFSVPKRTHIEIKVYDVTGRVSQILISKEIKPGNYSLRWDIGKILPAGIYFVEMRTKDFRKVHKMILIR